MIIGKNHLAQDNYNKELKTLLEVSGKKNHTSANNSKATLNKVTFESEESVLLDQSTLSTFN